MAATMSSGLAPGGKWSATVTHSTPSSPTSASRAAEPHTSTLRGKGASAPTSAPASSPGGASKRSCAAAQAEVATLSTCTGRPRLLDRAAAYSARVLSELFVTNTTALATGRPVSAPGVNSASAWPWALSRSFRTASRAPGMASCPRQTTPSKSKSHASKPLERIADSAGGGGGGRGDANGGGLAAGEGGPAAAPACDKPACASCAASTAPQRRSSPAAGPTTSTAGESWAVQSAPALAPLAPSAAR
mmetsp:Transcript_45066/g.101734  ORF Transcript_45066/g.101734 Transcript_45066/m.101734 type:complete len:247 (-) Transcript_45066:150-890(-)